MALLRPLSGSGAYGILASIIQNPSIGPDSYVGYLVSTFQGSTETTFYVLAVYFGAVGIRRIRHTLVAALCAHIVVIAAAVFIVSHHRKSFVYAKSLVFGGRRTINNNIRLLISFHSFLHSAYTSCSSV